jgi:hypothetical protein
MDTHRKTALIVGLVVALVMTVGFAVSHSGADTAHTGSSSNQTTSTTSYGSSSPTGNGAGGRKSLNAVLHTADGGTQTATRASGNDDAGKGTGTGHGAGPTRLSF